MADDGTNNLTKRNALHYIINKIGNKDSYKPENIQKAKEPEYKKIQSSEQKLEESMNKLETLENEIMQELYRK